MTQQSKECATHEIIFEREWMFKYSPEKYPSVPIDICYGIMQELHSRVHKYSVVPVGDSSLWSIPDDTMFKRSVDPDSHSVQQGTTINSCNSSTSKSCVAPNDVTKNETIIIHFPCRPMSKMVEMVKWLSITDQSCVTP